ncbi:unnamed protein product [Rotaria sp. Silwood1]|nr:unnamed protein product [Rotaria sp. Silwood1]
MQSELCIMISASDSEPSNVISGESYEPSNSSSNSYDDKELNEINEATNVIPAHSNETNLPSEQSHENLTSTHSNGTDEETSKSYESHNDKRDPAHFSLADFVQSQSVRI